VLVLQQHLQQREFGYVRNTGRKNGVREFDLISWYDTDDGVNSLGLSRNFVPLQLARITGHRYSVGYKLLRGEGHPLTKIQDSKGLATKIQVTTSPTLSRAFLAYRWRQPQAYLNLLEVAYSSFRLGDHSRGRIGMQNLLEKLIITSRLNVFLYVY
jgi:hypothetical protein